MIRVFYHKDNTIEKTDDLSLFSPDLKNQLLWIDLQFPSEQEKSTIEQFFNINFSTQQEESLQIFGLGAYFEKIKFNNFIEYGIGFSYMPDKLGYFIQYSNWAKSNYVSMGLIIGLKKFSHKSF